jgi:hypothetical protein
MSGVKVRECKKYGHERETVEFAPGVPIRFPCAEKEYQPLAANESEKLSRRWAS